MASERFSLTVLPVSVDPARDYHVSLHIAPRLTPTAGKNHLAGGARLPNGACR